MNIFDVCFAFYFEIMKFVKKIVNIIIYSRTKEEEFGFDEKYDYDIESGINFKTYFNNPTWISVDIDEFPQIDEEYNVLFWNDSFE